MANNKIEELKKDLEEAKMLLEKSERLRVKDSLALLIRKLESDLVLIKAEKTDDEEDLAASSPACKSKPKAACYNVKITNYAWDQSDKSLKFYITLKNVHSLPKENITCSFGAKSFELAVNGLDGYNHSLAIKNLLHPIVPDGCSFKVKSDDTIVIIAKKEVEQKWPQITVQEQKAKEARTPKYDETADPSQGLMHMLKQMYDDGDDDMKRTIAKAWTESHDKTGNVGF